MSRDLSLLSERQFDLVVVGGGIFGICAAWDAVRRGLRVAIVERGDFAHATSANSFKIVHGGIRYLQHADIYRVRESSRERTALLRIAPHLVHPLPIVIPTYGSTLKGRSVLGAGLAAYDLLVFDRNRGIGDPDRRIPRGRLISRRECLELFPGLETRGLTGGALFYDGQMYNPPRLALAFLKSAVEAGAVAANYVDVTGFLHRGERVQGVKVRDALSGSTFDIQAKLVLNAAGPWAGQLLEQGLGLKLSPSCTFSRDACFVVRRQFTGGHALALLAGTRDPDALVSRGARHLFIAPWQDYTLIGTWHVVHKRSPDDFSVTNKELHSFIDEVNAAYPALELTRNDVSLWNAGLVLFGENKPRASNLSYGKRSLIVDHGRTHGVEGLVTVIGVRWTTARGVADRAIRLVFKKLGERPPPCTTRETPVHGGTIGRIDGFIRDAIAGRPRGVTKKTIRQLARNYGTELHRVLIYARENAAWGQTIGESPILKAQIIHAVREEMAQKLGDVVFRRTDLGSAGHPGEAAVRECADLMASELGWSSGRREQEVSDVLRTLTDRGARPVGETGDKALRARTYLPA